MTFCGYNRTIAAGLETLTEGMIEAIKARTDGGKTLREVIEGELSDLKEMNGRLSDSPDLLLGALGGINSYAFFLFSCCDASDKKAFADSCRDLADRFLNIVREIDIRHIDYQTLRSGTGVDSPIGAVATWLLQLRADGVREG